MEEKKSKLQKFKTGLKSKPKYVTYLVGVIACILIICVWFAATNTYCSLFENEAEWGNPCFDINKACEVACENISETYNKSVRTSCLCENYMILLHKNHTIVHKDILNPMNLKNISIDQAIEIYRKK